MLDFHFEDGKVVVVGGMGIDTNPKDFFMSYDVVTNKWQALTSMPSARYATFTFLVKNWLYVIGKQELLSIVSNAQYLIIL